MRTFLFLHYNFSNFFKFFEFLNFFEFFEFLFLCWYKYHTVNKELERFMRLLRLALDIGQTCVHSCVLQRDIVKYEDDGGGFVRGLFTQTDPAKERGEEEKEESINSKMIAKSPMVKRKNEEEKRVEAEKVLNSITWTG